MARAMLGRDMRLLAAFAVLLGTAPAVAVAVRRYAAPGGAGTTCSAAVPCAVDEAITGAVSGDLDRTPLLRDAACAATAAGAAAISVDQQGVRRSGSRCAT
jgi:hypothetical protein